MMSKHLDILWLIDDIKKQTSTSYSEAVIDGLNLARELKRGEISTEDAVKKVLKESDKYIKSTGN